MLDMVHVHLQNLTYPDTRNMLKDRSWCSG